MPVGRQYCVDLRNAANPLLSQYCFNQNFAVDSGTPAIDASNDIVCAGAPVNGLDPRGVARPQGRRYDFGSYKFVDTTPPTVQTITRADTNPTSAASVHFAVTLAEAVTGVDTADFTLTKTGTISGAFVTGVTGGPTAYTVAVNTGTGNGTIRLDVPVSATITDLAGNPLASLPYTGGDDYTVKKIYWIYLPLIMH